MSVWGVLLVSLAVSVLVVTVSTYGRRHVAVKSLYARSEDGSILMLTGRGLMFTNDESRVRCELRPDGLYVYGPAIVVEPGPHAAHVQRIPSAPRIRLVAKDDGDAGLWLHRGVLLKDRPADDDVAKEFTTSRHLQAVEARQQELFDAARQG